DEALGELARRYFRSHAPATIRDFVWWSGLITAEARRAVEIAAARPCDLGGRTHGSMPEKRRAARRRRPVQLLPIYDEYLVAYRDRDGAADVPTMPSPSSSRSMIFQHTLVIGGHVAGTWRVVRGAAEAA